MSDKEILVIDYGLGNVRSVCGAVERVGYQPLLSADPQQIRSAKKLILPGVGAFGDGMNLLRARNLLDALQEAVLVKRTPILGICLGAQLFAAVSYEFGEHAGLGWIDAKVLRLDVEKDGLRVPHVGWNELAQKRQCELFHEVPANALFYYVHSYHIAPADESFVAGTCSYGTEFAAVLCRDNIYATQFHPEKSQQHGLTVLKNFLERT
jgi:imidazole glycerol-phosphate synthase subunit HisH